MRHALRGATCSAHFGSVANSTARGDSTSVTDWLAVRPLLRIEREKMILSFAAQRDRGAHALRQPLGCCDGFEEIRRSPVRGSSSVLGNPLVTGLLDDKRLRHWIASFEARTARALGCSRNLAAAALRPHRRQFLASNQALTYLVLSAVSADACLLSSWVRRRGCTGRNRREGSSFPAMAGTSKS